MNFIPFVFIFLCSIFRCETECQSALYMVLKCCDNTRNFSVKIKKCRRKKSLLIVAKSSTLDSHNCLLVYMVGALVVLTLYAYTEYIKFLVDLLLCELEYWRDLALRLILLSCGDVESNPGPLTQNLSILNGLLINARSIRNKVPQLQTLLNVYNIDFVAVTETWLDSSVNTSEIFDSSYQVHRKDRPYKKGGGVLIAFKSCFKVMQRDDLTTSSNTHNEILAVDILCKRLGKIVFIVCYRPPDDCSDEFVSNLKTTLQTCSVAGLNNICLLGDLNLPNVNWINMSPSCGSTFDTEMCNIFQEHCLNQSNFNPSTKHGHILDVILSNCPDRINNVHCEEDILNSDHYSLLFAMDIKVQSKLHVYKTIYNYKRTNFSDLISKISIDELDSICTAYSNDVDLLVSRWTEKVVSIIKAVVPTVKMKNFKSKPWIDSEVKHLVNLKETTRRKAKIRNTPFLWEKYRDYRNNLKQLIARKYNQYLVDESSEITTNPKRAWNLINTKTKTKRIPSLVNLDGTDASNQFDAACLFNNYFYSTFTDPNSYIDLPVVNIFQNPFLNNLIFTPSDVLNVLLKLNPTKASGHDGLDARVLKECAHVLAPSLTRIFNYSFQNGIFPKSWKLANVIPIHKGGSAQDVRNYRPVSLTCIVSKIFERCVYNKIFPYLVDKIHDLQHGFMKGLSTTTQLIQVYDEINAIVDKNGQVDSIYLDLSKAFDSISHRLLIHKIQCFGINGKLHAWLNNYLCDRQQRVVVEGKMSPYLPVISGVPQGSILGPLLFLLFINDLPTYVSERSKMALYADDAKLYRQINSYNDTLELQSDLEHVYNWSLIWNLKFNLKKCSVVTFTRKRNKIHFFYNIQGSVLKNINSITDLGIIVESNLSWDLHVKSVVKKAFNVLWFLKRALGKSVSASVKKMFYISLVRPHLEYGSIVWSVAYKKNLALLESVQRHASKYITGDYNSDYKTRLENCHLLPLSYRRELIDILFLFKRIHSNSVTFVLEKLVFSGRRGKLLINDVDIGLLLIQKVNTEIYKYFYTNRIVPLWNSIPVEIRQIQYGKNGASFKKQFETHLWSMFLANFQSDSTCTWVTKCRCAICR